MAGVAGYQILRGISSYYGNASVIGGSSVTSFDDTTAIPLQSYYYWVRSQGNAGPGVISNNARDSDWRAEPPAVAIAPGYFARLDMLPAENTLETTWERETSTQQPLATRRLRLLWNGSEGSRYQVQSSSSLAPDSWQDTDLPVTGSNDLQSIDVEIDATPQRFFRLLRLTP